MSLFLSILYDDQTHSLQLYTTGKTLLQALSSDKRFSSTKNSALFKTAHNIIIYTDCTVRLVTMVPESIYALMFNVDTKPQS